MTFPLVLLALFSLLAIALVAPHTPEAATYGDGPGEYDPFA